MMFLKQIITLVITGSVPHCTKLRSFSLLNASFYLIRWCIIIYLWKLQGWKSSDFFFHYFCKHRKPALNLKLWISPLCFLAGGLLLYTTGQKVSMTVVKNWLKVVRVKAVIHFSLRQPFANMYIYILQLQKNASWTHSVQIHHTFGKKLLKITKKMSSH